MFSSAAGDRLKSLIGRIDRFSAARLGAGSRRLDAIRLRRCGISSDTRENSAIAERLAGQEITKSCGNAWQ
jgi:hypothetical protein